MNKTAQHTEKTPLTGVCPKCGKTFTCTRNGQCWCMAVETDAETRAEIKRKYTSCLCPECLAGYAAKP